MEIRLGQIFIKKGVRGGTLTYIPYRTQDHMKKHVHEDLLTSVFFILVGLLFFLSSRDLAPETTYFPLMCAGGMIILCIPVLIRGIKETISMNKKSETNTTFQISWRELKGPILTFLMIIIYALCISFIGFFVSTFIFMMVFMYFQNFRKLIPMLVITVGFEILAWFVFVFDLHLRLPAGLLF